MKLFYYINGYCRLFCHFLMVQCPQPAGAEDIAKMEEMLQRRQQVFEENWTYRLQVLEKQLKRSQYQVDLQVT